MPETSSQTLLVEYSALQLTPAVMQEIVASLARLTVPAVCSIFYVLLKEGGHAPSVIVCLIVYLVTSVTRVDCVKYPRGFAVLEICGWSTRKYLVLW